MPIAKPKVFVSRDIATPGLELLNQHCDVTVWRERQALTPQEFRAAAAGSDAVLVVMPNQIDEAFLDAVPNLKVISGLGVGVDNIDLEACRRRGIPVGNTPDVLTDSTADVAWALLMATAWRVPEADTLVRTGNWKGFLPTDYWGTDVSGATIGIIGFGRIGQAVAQRAAGFNMEILFWNRSPKHEAAGAIGARQVELDELLSSSDFVSLNCPLTEETRGLINAERLSQMKPSGILINTARGGVVDQAALADALRNGTIRAAGLDVFAVEPLPGSDALTSLPNVVMTPHVGSSTAKVRGQMTMLAAKNILAGLKGDALPHPVA